MAGFDVQRVIAAYQQGKAIKDQKEQKVRDLEDRDWEIKQRQAQLKMDTIQQQLMKRKLEQENAAASEGKMAQEFTIPGLSAMGGSQTGEASPLQMGDSGGDGLQAIIQQLQSRQAPMYQAGTPGVEAQTKEVPLDSVEVSGIPELGVAGYTHQPKSAQDISRQKRSDQMAAANAKLLEPQKLGPGDILTAGGETIAINPKEPTQPAEKNQQFRDVERGGKVIRQYFEGSDPSKPTFEVELSTIKDKTDDPLTAAQRSNAYFRVTDKYQADPIINNAVKGRTAKAIADQVLANPGQATNQLKALYAFVKNLDPDSAVREGETALAQLTQSYLQSWGTALARINQGQILAPETAKQLAQATKELAAAWDSTAEFRTKQYRSQATVGGIGPQFDQYLAGYGGVAPTTGGGGAANPYR